MAKFITALTAYRPKLILGRSVKMKELAEHIAGRTGLNKGEIMLTLCEFSEAIIFFNKQGKGVKLEGLGTYLPSMDTQGHISVAHRLDNAIKNALNEKGAYVGEIVRKQNIGKTNEQFIEMWNKDHTSDPVEL